MYKKYFTTILVLIVVWQFMFFYVDNKYILASPLSVFELMFEKTFQIDFYKSIFYTIGRITIGVSISLLISGILAIFSRYNKDFANYLRPITILLKAIPNVAYIVLLLIWFGKELSTVLLLIITITPVLYSNFMSNFAHIPIYLDQVKTVFSSRKIRTVIKVEIPYIKYYMLRNILSVISLAMKITIMGEILTQVNEGLGSDLNNARYSLDMASLMSETIWIAFLSLFIDVVLTNFVNKRIELNNL